MSSAAAPSPIERWMLSQGLSWNASLASQLAARGVSHVEQIKLLEPSEWDVLFVTEPDVLRRQAVMVYDALLGSGPFDPQKCVAVWQEAAAVHPHSEDNAAACQEAVVAAALGQDVAAAAPSLDGAPVAEFCGLIVEDSVPDRPFSAPLENETFRSDEIFGLDDSNREHNRSVNGNEGEARAETNSMPINPTEDQLSGRERATNCGFSDAFLSSMTESQVQTSMDLLHSVQARTRECTGLDASHNLAWGLERIFDAGVSAIDLFGQSEEKIEQLRLNHPQKQEERLVPSGMMANGSSPIPLENETGDAPGAHSTNGKDTQNEEQLPLSRAPQAQPQPPQPQAPQAQLQLQHAPTPDPLTSLPFPGGSEVTTPLRQWVRNETLAGQLSLVQHRQSLVRKTVVAYGLAELLHHLNSQRKGLEHGSLLPECAMDNFAVRMANCRDATIEGVDILSHPGVGVNIISPFFLSDEFLGAVGANDGQTEELGQFLEVEIKSDATANPSTDAMANDGQVAIEETSMCHAFGGLLYELYSETRPSAESNRDAGGEEDSLSPANGSAPRRKKTALDLLSINDDAASPFRASQVGGDSAGVAPRGRPTKLKELGFPASVSLLVNDLLECDWGEFTPVNAIPSLKAASEDLHLMLQDPNRFLFDRIPDRRGAAALDVKQNKLYGREKERSLVTDLFCRVSMTGETEALIIEGFSGSGKSTLVESLVEYVDVAGAYIIQQKFGQISQDRSMAVVISAFNDLCALISRKRTPEELHAIVIALMAVFGTQLSTLARVLPNVMMLSPDLNVACHESTEINLSRVCYILQLFMRVVSSREHPVMIFLDDLQWGDSASFDMLTEVLSDIKGSSCLYFIGSYRGNEVSADHPIYKFMANLEACSVDLSRIRLDGMGIDDVNRMVSDTLGTVPRICRPLSRIVLRRTEGNPLFILESLRSLADKNLLHYSFRERRWEWDIDKIAAENIADNVCELLTTKMTGLPESSQRALKIASCFGNTITTQIVEILALASPDLSMFRQELERAVGEGFMNKDESGSTYTFAHDKVREAAYSLIDNTSQFHHKIGMLLFHALEEQMLDSMIFVVVDQINHGDIQDPGWRLKIAGLNHRAASKAMGNSNFASAYFYSTAAIKLLPRDHWDIDYDLSRNIFLVMGNAAYTEGHIEEATSALESILTNGRSLEDKLDAYFLKISLLNSRQEGKVAYDTCIEVLTRLGESIPATVTPENFVDTSNPIQLKLSDMTELNWMSMKEMANPLHLSLMKFYSSLSFISYFVNPPMLKWYACRLVELSLEHGVCRFSALGLTRYAAVLCGRLFNDIEEGYRVGKMALKLMDRFDATELLPSVYLVYYGYIAVHVEPFQSCAAMLKRGYEIGLSTGDIQMALMEGINFIQKSFASGANLLALKKECDHQLRLIDAHSQTMTKIYTSAFQETISMIIGKEATEEDPVSKAKDFSESLIFHHVLRSFWSGHYSRCLYHAEKFSAFSDIGQLRSIIIMFYAGVSCFHAGRKHKITQKRVRTVKQAISAMTEMGKRASWNYQNKIQLLTAQLESATGKKDEAKISFNAAIASARSSKFTHEQGLACELMAFHCLKHLDYMDAMNLFQQARQCYSQWGSQMKVDFITAQIEETAKKLES